VRNPQKACPAVGLCALKVKLSFEYKLLRNLFWKHYKVLWTEAHVRSYVVRKKENVAFLLVLQYLKVCS